jgi:hypothetical protein
MGRRALEFPSDLVYCGNGFFLFILESEEARDKIFKSRPYIMGSRGLFLSHWTIDFDPNMEISVAHAWVKLLHLPMIF